jgi:Spy/CpxP family protein refolding chaperone
MKAQLGFIVLIAAALGAAGLAGAQTAPSQAPAPTEGAPPPLSQQDVDLLRKDLRSQKKQLVAQNLKLSDEEATKFWPIYDQYTAELVRINNKKYAVIQQYANGYGTLSGEQAMSLMKQWMDVDIAAAQLRAKYLPIVAKAIGDTKAATFAQIDRRIALMIELQLASRLPLAQSQ